MAALSIARHSSIRTPPDGVNHSKPVITPHKYESQLRRGPTPLIDFRHDPRNQTDPLSFLLSVINSAFHKLPATTTTLMYLNEREKLPLICLACCTKSSCHQSCIVQIPFKISFFYLFFVVDIHIKKNLKSTGVSEDLVMIMKIS